MLKRIIFTFALYLVPFLVFAEDTSTDTQQNRAELLSALLWFAYILSFTMGLVALKHSVDLIGRWREESQRGDTSSTKRLIGTLMIAGVLLAPQSSINLALKTFGIAESGDNGGYCYAYDTTFEDSFTTTYNAEIKDADNPVDASGLVSNTATIPSCITEPINNIQKELSETTASATSSVWDNIKTNDDFQFLIGIMQTIAVFYYFNSWFTVWAILDGRERNATYKGQFLSIAAASFVINLPATITLLLNTYQSLF
ncbi:hypothetical protein EHJ37_19675 [Vibrio parahaemolyticus]|nr:hypothetical protein [Vibrio parahaemolyticus]